MAGLFNAVKRTARTTDPITSRLNKPGQAKRVKAASILVKNLFENYPIGFGAENGWTDQEIERWFDSTMDTVLSPQSLRMARLALAEAGKIKHVGFRRTVSGGKARVWVKA